MNREKIGKLFKNKTTRTVFVLLIALLLVVAVYCVFFRTEKSSVERYQASELEKRLSNILSRIDGVGETTVLVGEEDGRAVSAVIVFRGADSILTRMRVIDAASGALGIGKDCILVYPAES